MKRIIFVLALMPMFANAYIPDSSTALAREEGREGRGEESRQFNKMDENRSMGRTDDERFRRDENLNNFRRPAEINVNQEPGAIYMPGNNSNLDQQPQQFQQDNFYPQ